jgi:hypothetical protein
MTRDAVLAYACWSLAAILGTVIGIIIIASIVSWAT